MSTSDYRDIVITDLADHEAALLELVADLTWENYQLRRAFRRVLRMADDARLEAQRQCDDLWATLSDDHEAA